LALLAPWPAKDALAAPEARTERTPERRPPGARTGPSAALGIGHGYGLLGLQLSFPIAVSQSLALGPFLGVGGLPAHEEAEGVWTVAGGLLGYWGTRHRLLLELSVAPVALRTLDLHGTRVATDAAYGPAAIVGYEFVSDPGFLVRAGAGAGAPIIEDSGIFPLISVGLGWKW
jgi:hypothetical protein